MTDTLYMKRLAFTIITMVLLVFALPPMVMQLLGMFAIGWLLPDIAKAVFPENK